MGMIMTSFFNGAFKIDGINTQGWPTTGVNQVFAAFWRTSGNLSDAIVSTLNVTGTPANDKTMCYDGYLKNVNDTSYPNILKDKVDNVLWDMENSTSSYYTVGTIRYLNWTVIFGRPYDT
jgi:hypothetical protein